MTAQLLAETLLSLRWVAKGVFSAIYGDAEEGAFFGKPTC